jgi:hypothetical protein
VLGVGDVLQCVGKRQSHGLDEEMKVLSRVVLHPFNRALVKC